MLHDDISEQISRLKSMKNNKSLIVISVIARMVFMFYFFEPISFTTSVFISLVGLLAVAKSNKILLSIYGYMTLFQAIAIYCFLMFFSMSNPQPILIYGVYSLFIVVMSVGASSSFSLRNQIRNYENMFGDVNSRTISNRANNDRDELQMIQIDNQQQPINSINNNSSNNYYIIPNNNLISANNNINNLNNNNNLIFQEDDSPQNDTNTSLIIPQHFIPNVYSSSPKLDQYILSPLQSPKVQQPQEQAFTSPVFQQAPFSPIPQFHIHFPNQMSSPTSSPYANQYQAQGVNRQQHPPSHFVPQVIHHQRNTQRRNVIYQI